MTNIDKNTHDMDPKTKMLLALEKKQKVHKSGKRASAKGGSKVGAGQTANTGPKMHRRKTGPA